MGTMQSADAALLALSTNLAGQLLQQRDITLPLQGFSVCFSEVHKLNGFGGCHV
jgi:hypothetical protein